MFKTFFTFAAVLGGIVVISHAGAREVLVEDQQAFNEAVAQARPGDTIVLANGRWADFEIVLAGHGTAEQPIKLEAQTKGKVIISGRSNLRLAGEHLVVSGLVFRDGYSPTNTVISFRRNKNELANYSRVTEVVVDHFNNPERFETDFWVMMYGQHNRFDHNHLAGKSNAGVTMAVRLDSEASQNNHHRIDHNYFGPRQALGSNGGETLRIGTSHYSLTDSHTLVENNYFDRCNGEVEIISVKAGRNTVRGNVFFESRGTLTLRHGNHNTVEDNVFFGNGVDHTGGIRVINKHQTVRNNYLSGLTGHRFGGGLVIMNGVPDSPINRYHQVEHSVVENNTLIDVRHVELAAGSDEERSAVPLSTRFERNLLVNREPMDSIAVHDDISGISFSGNIASGVAKLPAESGFTTSDVALVQHDNGLWYAQDEDLAAAGVARDVEVLERTQTGVSWYPKPGYDGPFETGVEHAVEPGEDTILAAVSNANDGDVLLLSPGEYVASKTIDIDRSIAIRAADPGEPLPRLLFERTALFQLNDGGSLKLADVELDGAVSPDTYGNAAVRTTRYSMLDNYRLVAERIVVRNLNTNHSFHFLKVASHTFADEIVIRDSTFTNVSGNIVALDREIEDLGIYNGEYVTITGSRFENVEGAVVNLYRGGTDESTFGPHLKFVDNDLTSVGNGRRNKARAALKLHGVQMADIHRNRFQDSAGIRVITTVGDPITRISENKRDGTPDTQIVDVNQL